MTNAAIYARISRDDLADEKGVNRQLKDCRATAARRGWSVAREYVDNDVSAYSGKVREQYRRLLDDMRSGAVQALVVWNNDRLHRNNKELEEFIDVVEETHTPIAVCKQGERDLDLTTSDGRALARVVGAFAVLESDRKAERLRRKAEELAQEGTAGGASVRPFGYAAGGIAVDEAEAALVREAAARVIAGDSIRSIAADWAARGVTTTTGCAFAQTSLRRVLLRARNVGVREHFTTERVNGRARKVLHCTAEAVWPAILDRSTHDALRVILGDPGRTKTGRREPFRYILTGLVFCSNGHRMVARPTGERKRRYICAKGPTLDGCGRAIQADPLEELVVETTIERLDSGAFASLVTEAERRPDSEPMTLGRLRADEMALEQLSRDHYVDELISRAEFLAARRPLEQRIEQARERLLEGQGRRPAAALVGSARVRWPELSWDRRRAVLTGVIERITIGEGRRGYNRFEPTRVDVRWSDEGVRA